VVAAAWNRVATEAFLRRHGPFDALLVMSQRRLGVEPLRVFQRHEVPAVFTVNDDWPAAYGPVTASGWKRLAHGVLDRGPWARHTFRGVRVDRVVYLSDSVRDQVRKAVPCFPKGIVQAQGVDMERFFERPFRTVEPPLRLLFVGRLHPTKAPDVAIDALHALRAAGVEARLALAGAPVNQVYGDELTQRVRELGLDNHVDWLGQVDRDALPQVYREADVMLFLNRWNEPQGLTYMEAMACGVPVVAHPMGGARELLERWPAATIVPTCTGQAVADGVRSLVADPALTLRQVDMGRRMLREAASLDHYVDVLEGQLFDAASYRSS
jgi:glycosyltransferase involved in cell wall biosynthesis